MSVTPPAGRFYAIRTTVGQEKNIALILETRLRSQQTKITSIKSILVIDDIRGFVFIEADLPSDIDRIIARTKYIKGKVGGVFTYNDLEKFIKPKPIIEEIEVNDIVEIISGPFRGMKGKVTHVDKAKGEIKVEISEAAYPLPITISADYVRIVKKGGT